MRVLILGGSGMLGHKLWQSFNKRFDTYVTFRQPAASFARHGLFNELRARGRVSAQDFDSVVRTLADVRPEAVVNCIGIVKQDEAAKDPYQSIVVNALFPHRLAQLCRASRARLIHISTDCVFSGRRGGYTESDTTDAEDVYGRTKALGEVDYENCWTIRTSMIGRELAGTHGLIEWFLGQRGKTVRGFKRAVFSGFTTEALASIIADVVAGRPELRGIWHVSADPINKFALLTLIKKAFGLDLEIEPDETFVCDRSLDSRLFRQATGFAPPSWPEMVEGMVRDNIPYEEIRKKPC